MEEPLRAAEGYVQLQKENHPTQGKGWKVVNENGRPILHYEGIEHPIVKVKERYVNGERVVDYVVEDGTKFEHWTRQGDMVPPWVTHWWQLRGTTTVYLRGCTLRELARKAVERAGSQRKLAKCVLKLDQSGISRILSGQYKGICIGSLRRPLDFLETGYSSFQPEIEAIGRLKSIRNPGLPFSLATPAEPGWSPLRWGMAV